MQPSQIIHSHGQVDAEDVADIADAIVKETQEKEQRKLPPNISLLLILIANLLFNISFYIIIPTATQYAKSLGGGALFSGLVIGAVTFISTIMLVPFSKLHIFRHRYRPTLDLASACLLIGHVLYALAMQANFLYLILLGRLINGFGFTGWFFVKCYCTDPRIVGLCRRTMCCSLLVAAQTLGMVVGPILGGQLARIPINNRLINPNTLPGWVMAIVWLLYWVFVRLFFEDVKDNEIHISNAFDIKERRHVKDNVEKLDENQGVDTTNLRIEIKQAICSMDENRGVDTTSLLIEQRHTQDGEILSYTSLFVAGVMSFSAFTVFFELGAWEATIPIYGKDVFGWSEWDSGLFIGLTGLGSFFLIFPMSFASHRLEDRITLAFGFLIGALGLVLHLAMTMKAILSLASYGVSWFLVCWGFNLSSTITLSLTSKILPDHLSNKAALAIQLSNYMGRFTGAIWGTAGSAVGNLTILALELGIAAGGLLMIFSTWRLMLVCKG